MTFEEVLATEKQLVVIAWRSTAGEGPPQPNELIRHSGYSFKIVSEITEEQFTRAVARNRAIREKRGLSHTAYSGIFESDSPTEEMKRVADAPRTTEEFTHYFWMKQLLA